VTNATGAPSTVVRELDDAVPGAQDLQPDLLRRPVPAALGSAVSTCT
jgi:hypothetical protein